VFVFDSLAVSNGAQDKALAFCSRQSRRHELPYSIELKKEVIIGDSSGMRWMKTTMGIVTSNKACW